jgi:hypothetical protein
MPPILSLPLQEPELSTNHPFPFSIILNTTPCQFTVSKTRRSIQYIQNLIASKCIPNAENGIHNITLVITNNTLLDTYQYRIRIEDSKGLNVGILSSSKLAKYNYVDNIMGSFASLKKADDLDDVIVMCNHGKRIDDIKKLIESFYIGRINLQDIGIHRISFTIMFDEADVIENLNHACEVLDSIKEYNNIESVHLLTATPVDKFWKKLRIHGINKLLSISNYIDEVDNPEYLIESYHKLRDNDIISNIDTSTTCTFTNIKSIYESKIAPLYKLGESENPIRLFAAGDRNKESHKKICEYFIKKNFICVKINSDKHDAIQFPDNLDTEPISLIDFNNKYFKKSVHMYDSLAKLNELYSHTDIIITGLTCIERGITFNSIGFNFTHVIIPPKLPLAMLIQIMGRSNGDKQYVNKHTIFISVKQCTEAEIFMEKQLHIIRTNPEIITVEDYRNKTQRELEEKYMTIPERIELSQEEYVKLTEKRGNKFANIPDIKNKITNTIGTQCLEGYEKALYSEPVYNETNRNCGYNKNILPIKNAFEKREKFVILHKQEKAKKIKLYSVYFDSQNHHMYILKWNGDAE